MSKNREPEAALPRALSFVRAKFSPMTAFWLIIVSILVLPIILFLAVAFSPKLLDQGPQWFTFNSFKAAADPYFVRSIWHSFLLGVISAIAATSIAVGVAWIVLRTNASARKIWNLSIFALLLAPSYLIAMGANF